MLEKPYNYRLAFFIFGCSPAIVVFLRFVPRITQDQEYHRFADQRTIFGISNFWDVISNTLFAVAGALGLWKTNGIAARLLFTGVLLTSFGSAYYHLAPDDSRLVWDRLPMTVVFMSMVAIVIDRARGGDWSGRLVLPLTILGASSVMWWRLTGNLAPYILVQFGSMLMLLLALLFNRSLRALWIVLALYVLAKVAELYDRAIYSILPISGHTCKHLLSGVAAFCLLRWLYFAKVPKRRLSF